LSTRALSGTARVLGNSSRTGAIGANHLSTSFLMLSLVKRARSSASKCTTKPFSSSQFFFMPVTATPHNCEGRSASMRRTESAVKKYTNAMGSPFV